MIEPGDKAPEVAGTTYGGRRIDLGHPVTRTVLWFYPKASTGG